MIYVVWSLIPVAVLIVGAILIAEERYYARHPEKERPDPSPWP